MGFLQKNQERVQATRAFCQLLLNMPDPLAKYLNEIGDPDDRVAWAIMGEALSQGVSVTEVIQLLTALRHAFPGNSAWALPAPREGQIRKVMGGIPWVKGWGLEAHVPGILYSVGHWLRQRPSPISHWIETQETGSLWKQMSDIYYMGRKSTIRPKVLSVLHRLRSPSPRGLGLSIRATALPSGNPWPLPVTSGARKWLHLIGPDPVRWMESHSDVDRLQYFQKMYAGLWKGQAAAVAHGLSFFMVNHGADLLCRIALGGCLQCPLAQMSPLAGQCPGRRV